MFTEIENPPRPLTKPAKGPQTSNPIPNQKRLSADASPHLESKDLRSELAEVNSGASEDTEVMSEAPTPPEDLIFSLESEVDDGLGFQIFMLSIA